jgi:solute carrier family 30 (zinc transporter), member 9
MSHGSGAAVYTAIGANTVVMLAKFAGFFMTGSGAMLSEGIHSMADVGNQTLLAVGMKKAERPADDDHPFGYGKDAFVWSLISAVGIFFVGCGATIMHGVQSLSHPDAHGAEGGMLNLGILLFALVLEGGSFGVAVWGLAKEARHTKQTFFQHIRSTDDPFGVAVLLEDAAAVLGVFIALAAVGLAHITGEPYWDAIGSIAIGLLLGFVALFLIRKNRIYLLDIAIRPEHREKLRELLINDPAIEGVAVQRAAVSGTAKYRISAELDFDGAYLARKYLETRNVVELHGTLDSPDALQVFLEQYGEDVMELMGDEVDRIEDKIRDAMPGAKNIALEPD